MKDLISADIIRILRKPSYRILLLISFLLVAYVAIKTRFDVWDGYQYTSRQYTMMELAGELLLGIMIYLSVYADEFTSNSMQVIIGRGVSRFRLILSKFVNCVVISFISFAAYTALVLILGIILGAGMTGEEAFFILLSGMNCAVKTVGFSTISMIVLYATRNVALATLTDVILTASYNLWGGLFDMIPWIKFIHPERVFFSGAVDIASANLMLGNRAAFFIIIFQLVKVSAISILISYLIFRKKELEFF